MKIDRTINFDNPTEWANKETLHYRENVEACNP
jgi:hypothetical protein